ncbi:CD63 antigen [Orchesella cincta]|uniref:CD63 antigen n=1 Tax=Orchesella cincta TaxID=48709 RepID=A0A1D2N688_ORCCI|nr:CD63 antigen [Orchesella cincta]
MPDKRPTSPSPNRHRSRLPKRVGSSQEKPKYGRLPSGESIAESYFTTSSVPELDSRTTNEVKLADFSESSLTSSAGTGIYEITIEVGNTSDKNAARANPQTEEPTSIDWNPTISHEEMCPVGEACPKPKDTMTLDSDGKTIQRNLRIVSSNIRRNKMIIWMLIFCLVMSCEGFMDLLVAIIKEENEVFSMNLIKPYLLPALTCEFVLTFICLIFIVVRMGFLGSRKVKRAYRIATVLNCLQYLTLMLLLPLVMYIFNTQLATDMKKELSNSLSKQKYSEIWAVTQSYRQCCGITNRTDWIESNARSQYRQGLLKDIVRYPNSCCRDFDASTNAKGYNCTELSGNFWTMDCHHAEFLSMLDYMLWFIAYVFFAFVSTVRKSNYLNVSFTNDDYELLNALARKTRSGNDQLDGLYSIESADNRLVLTAKNGGMTLGSVILRKWYNVGSQLWLVTKFNPGRGYNLKPLANEFNSVTSTLENNAHAFNAWEFKNTNTPPGTYVIFNAVNMRCLQAPSSTNAHPVEFAKCHPKNKLQQWKLNKQE